MVLTQEGWPKQGQKLNSTGHQGGAGQGTPNPEGIYPLTFDVAPNRQLYSSAHLMSEKPRSGSTLLPMVGV